MLHFWSAIVKVKWTIKCKKTPYISWIWKQNYFLPYFRIKVPNIDTSKCDAWGTDLHTVSGARKNIINLHHQMKSHTDRTWTTFCETVLTLMRPHLLMTGQSLLGCIPATKADLTHNVKLYALWNFGYYTTKVKLANEFCAHCKMNPAFWGNTCRVTSCILYLSVIVTKYHQ